MIETYLPRIIAALKSTHGDEFFNIITRELNDVIGADYTFIARLDLARNMSRTVSLVAHGELAENFEYSLENTPCSDVTNDDICIYPSGICQFYPDDQLLVDMNIEGYIGTPLKDSEGKVMGIVVALYENKIADTDMVVSLFELFSGRISVEIERTEKGLALETLAGTLENQVQERTMALSDAMENLKMAQHRLIDQEKFALLGNMVTGVAHEINTPLGVAVLSASNIGDVALPLLEKVRAGQIKRSELEQSLEKIIEFDEALNVNLRRASELISNLKQVAVEKTAVYTKSIDLGDFFQDLLVSLGPMLSKRHVNVSIPETSLQLTTDQSRLSQVIFNLVNNSLLHAFDQEQEDKRICVSINELENAILLSVSDNGKGMDEETQDKMFEPFFTTRRGKGGTGLGLNIVYNTVKRALNGDIKVLSAPGQGTTVTIELPKVA